jgi:hypothetical protein
MTDEKPDTRKPFGKLRLPPGMVDVTSQKLGKTFAIIGVPPPKPAAPSAVPPEARENAI